MFNSRSLLVGLVATFVSFGVGNDRMAIAQNAPKSTRYVSDQEIQVLMADSLARVSGGSRFFQERRSPSEISKINNFVNAWQKVDPSIAPFLGDWGGWESSLAIYPSQTKGQVCLISTYYISDRVGVRTVNEFSLGKVSGNKLLTDNEKRGKQVIIKERGTVRSGESIEFLAIFGVYNRRVEPSEVVNRKLLREVKSSRLAKFGCTTSLPSNNQTQISAQKHPAEVVVSNFYTWYLNNSRHREILYQQKESFTPNLYRYLDRAIRITQANNQWSGMLNYDLFSFTQVGSYSFQITSVVPKENSTEVYLNLEVGLRRSRNLQPIKVIVIRNGNSWQIDNFYFLSDPSKNYNLLSELIKFNQIQRFQNVPWEN